MTIAEAVQAFYRRCRAEGVSVNTIKTYSAHFKKFVLYCADNNLINLDNVTTDDLRKYIIHCRDIGYAPHTVQDVHRSLSVFFRWLYDENRILTNPMKPLKRPRVPKEYARTFSAREVKLILDYFDVSTFCGFRNKFIMLVFLGTGIRKSELLRLKLADVDLENRVLKINGKGGKQRFVPISTSLLRSFRQYLSKREDYLNDMGMGQSALFITRMGSPMSKSALEEVFAQVKSGLAIDKRRLSPHTFRHTFARAFLSNGGNLFSLQDILGHEDIATTRIYVEFNVAGNRAQMDEFCPIDNIGWQFDD